MRFDVIGKVRHFLVFFPIYYLYSVFGSNYDRWALKFCLTAAANINRLFHEISSRSRGLHASNASRRRPYLCRTILYDIRFFFFWLLWIGCSRCIDNSRSALYAIISIQVAVRDFVPLPVALLKCLHCINGPIMLLTNRQLGRASRVPTYFRNCSSYEDRFPIKSVKPYMNRLRGEFSQGTPAS